VQRDILEKLNIKIHAEPFWKRAMAERAIREIKLRMAVCLDLKGRKTPPPDYRITKCVIFLFSGLSLQKWRDHLAYVIDTINRGKPNFKSQFNLLMEYFTAPSTIMVPQQQDRFYKYKLGQRVRVNLSKTERTTLGFKYSLNYGTPDYRICFKIFC
jgi:hypothetical protein